MWVFTVQLMQVVGTKVMLLIFLPRHTLNKFQFVSEELNGLSTCLLMLLLFAGCSDAT